jgi:type IV pilus assembly protein PilC
MTAITMLFLMIIWVIPKFSVIYSQFRVPLPWPTRLLLAISHLFVTNLIAVVSVLLALAFGIWFWSRTDRGRLWIDRLKVDMPVFGPLIRMYAVTKFARTLGMLTSSGTHILYALRVMKPVPGNRVLERGIDAMRTRVEEGDSLSKAMADTQVFPEMLVQMTATGEETGQLDSMLSRTADFYEQRVSAAVDGLSSLIEPIAIVVLGGIIGVMLLSLYLPIFNLGQAMRQGLTGQ